MASCIKEVLTSTEFCVTVEEMTNSGLPQTREVQLKTISEDDVHRWHRGISEHAAVRKARDTKKRKQHPQQTTRALDNQALRDELPILSHDLAASMPKQPITSMSLHGASYDQSQNHTPVEGPEKTSSTNIVAESSMYEQPSNKIPNSPIEQFKLILREKVQVRVLGNRVPTV